MAIKSTASKFLNDIFQKNAIDHDPRTWAVAPEKGPKIWNISSVPECVLTRWWGEDGTGWFLEVHHVEAPGLDFLVRVFGVRVFDWKLGMYTLPLFQT